MNPAFTRKSRRENLQRLGAETFDVLIIGGGINGAGIARDLALRAQEANAQLKVALVEQRHFASGTSGKNSQLIHGGLRYLKQLQLRLVRESLLERSTLLEIAPHLVKPLPFILPMYSWWSKVYYGSGLQLYDWLAGTRNVGLRRSVSPDELARLEPGLNRDNLKSAAIFYDCLVNSARFVLENIFDAARGGTVIANYCRYEGFEQTDKGVYLVRLTDTRSGAGFEARTRSLVDARGPWAGDDLRLVRGSHLVLPRVGASEHAVAHFEQHGRIIFSIPWGSRNELSLFGTTDEDHQGSPDEVSISRSEVGYLLGILHRLFPGARSVHPIAAFSSLRPLVRSESASATNTSREHRIWRSNDGVIRITGGKYTTYRIMSSAAADLATAAIAPELAGKCATAHAPLGGNTPATLQELETKYKGCALEVRRAVQDYGVLVEHVLEYAHANGSFIAGQVQFAVEHEMVERLADLLYVSTYWGYERPWSHESLRPLAEEVGKSFGWNREEIDEEIRLALSVSAIPGIQDEFRNKA